MNFAPRVILDAPRGEIRVGSTAVPVRAAQPEGALRIGGPGGPVLRPLTFGERSRVTAQAAAAPHPPRALCAATLALATVSPARDEADASSDTAPLRAVLREIVALFLAGAGEPGRPSFSAAALVVAQATGWSPLQLAACPAAEMDRLALELGAGGEEGPPASAWSEIRLVSDPAEEVALIRDEYAADLLSRAGAALPSPGAQNAALASPPLPVDATNALPAGSFPPLGTEPWSPGGAPILRQWFDSEPDRCAAPWGPSFPSTGRTEPTHNDEISGTRPARKNLLLQGRGNSSWRVLSVDAGTARPSPWTPGPPADWASTGRAGEVGAEPAVLQASSTSAGSCNEPDDLDDSRTRASSDPASGEVPTVASEQANAGGTGSARDGRPGFQGKPMPVAHGDETGSQPPAAGIQDGSDTASDPDGASRAGTGAGRAGAIREAQPGLRGQLLFAARGDERGHGPLAAGIREDTDPAPGLQGAWTVRAGTGRVDLLCEVPRGVDGAPVAPARADERTARSALTATQGIAGPAAGLAVANAGRAAFVREERGSVQGAAVATWHTQKRQVGPARSGMERVPGPALNPRGAEHGLLQREQALFQGERGPYGAGRVRVGESEGCLAEIEATASPLLPSPLSSCALADLLDAIGTALGREADVRGLAP